LLASTFPSILPPLTGEEILEIASIYSVNGMLPQDLSLISRRPFRVPHAHASSVELTGGGSPARPGEVSLAHQGVLFLDDLSLFGSHALEPLYLSLGEKRVRLQWQQQVIFYPARTLLIATLKPCPCGFRNDLIQECICTTSALELYQKRISGLLPGCFDIFVEVPRIAYEKLASKRQAETSAVIRDRVQAARERQRERFKGSKLTCNAEMGPDEVREFCQTDPSGEKLLSAATRQLHLSARGYHRVLRLARTIADLAGSEMIMANHLAEAIQYRPGMGL
jgi:magnesium chelatase family protein